MEENPIKHILKELSLGNTVQIVAKGNSMEPRIIHGQIYTIEPYDDSKHKLEKGTIVFVRVNNKFRTHQIVDIINDEYVIGNIANKIDGQVKVDAIYGIKIDNIKDFNGVTVVE